MKHVDDAMDRLRGRRRCERLELLANTGPERAREHARRALAHLAANRAERLAEVALDEVAFDELHLLAPFDTEDQRTERVVVDGEIPF